MPNFIFIIGVAPRQKKISEGDFVCPSCQQKRPYTQVKSAQWLSLFFIPVFPLGKGEEYVTCHHCRQSYEPQVLEKEFQKAAVPDLAPAPVSDAYVQGIRSELDYGTPLHMAQQKLINQGLESQLAAEVVEAAAGPSRKACPPCNMRYRYTVERCANCGKKLVYD